MNIHSMWISSKKILFVFLIVLIGGVIMPRGGPDGNLQPYEYASQEVDPGSIYQMLWGFSPIDSKGRVLYFDTFNNGLGGWGKTITGTGVQPVIFSDGNNATGLIFSPPNCVRLDPGTTVNSLSHIFRQLSFGLNPRVGMEAAVTIATTMPNYRVMVDYRPFNSATSYTTRLELDVPSSQWRIMVLGGGTQNILAETLSATAAVTKQVKIVGDFATGKYIRAFIGENQIDLSAYNMPLTSTANPTSPTISIPGMAVFTMRAVSHGAGATVPGYIGYVLLTKDEP